MYICQSCSASSASRRRWRASRDFCAMYVGCASRHRLLAIVRKRACQSIQHGERTGLEEKDAAAAEPETSPVGRGKTPRRTKKTTRKKSTKRARSTYPRGEQGSHRPQLSSSRQHRTSRVAAAAGRRSGLKSGRKSRSLGSKPSRAEPNRAARTGLGFRVLGFRV